MPLSLGLVPEFLRHAQRQQSRHADYPVVFSDPSDPEGLTYAQAVFSRDFGQRLIECQEGSVAEHYRIALAPCHDDDEGILIASRLIQYWIQYGSAVKDQADWEKDTCDPNKKPYEYRHTVNVRINPKTKQFCLN